MTLEPEDYAEVIQLQEEHDLRRVSTMDLKAEEQYEMSTESTRMVYGAAYPPSDSGTYDPVPARTSGGLRPAGPPGSSRWLSNAKGMMSNAKGLMMRQGTQCMCCILALVVVAITLFTVAATSPYPGGQALPGKTEGEGRLWTTVDATSGSRKLHIEGGESLYTEIQFWVDNRLRGQVIRPFAGSGNGVVKVLHGSRSGNCFPLLPVTYAGLTPLPPPTSGILIPDDQESIVAMPFRTNFAVPTLAQRESDCTQVSTAVVDKGIHPQPLTEFDFHNHYFTLGSDADVAIPKTQHEQVTTDDFDLDTYNDYLYRIKLVLPQNSLVLVKPVDGSVDSVWPFISTTGYHDPLAFCSGLVATASPSLVSLCTELAVCESENAVVPLQGQLPITEPPTCQNARTRMPCDCTSSFALKLMTMESNGCGLCLRKDSQNGTNAACRCWAEARVLSLALHWRSCVAPSVKTVSLPELSFVCGLRKRCTRRITDHCRSMATTCVPKVKEPVITCYTSTVDYLETTGKSPNVIAV